MSEFILPKFRKFIIPKKFKKRVEKLLKSFAYRVWLLKVKAERLGK